MKRYARITRRGESLKPRKGDDRPLKADESTIKLFEENVKQRSGVTIPDRRRLLESLTGRILSGLTVGRPLKGLGFSRKKRLWGR